MDFVILIFLALIAYKVFVPQGFLPQHNKRIILDSCALIDGRIVQLSKAGFVSSELIIPEFIIHELQLLADGSDTHKRDRARFGLDVVKELQDNRNLHVSIDKERVPEQEKTDDKLVGLAQKRAASLYTTDYNLGKVAAIKDVPVLNVNELAGLLRPVVLPGEERTVKLIQKGNSTNQAVGYLEDGTMIVVEGAVKYIGKTVKVSITRMHQTVAGKMAFGDIVKSLPAASDRRLQLRRRSTRNPI